MDIDIDISPDFYINDIFKNIINASIVEKDVLKKHNVGLYFQNIPIDKETQLSAIPYNKAEEYGYTKIDFLTLNILNNFKNKDEIRTLLKKEPNWKLLEYEEVVKELFHISNHFDTISMVKPKSINDLADVLALIRPNKIKLLGKYLKNKEETRKELFNKIDKSDLRKSHSIPYAMLIVLNLHLIERELNL